MPHECRVGLAEGPYDARDVEGEVRRVVAAWGAVAAADAAQIHGHGPEPGVGERHHLVPPRPPELGEAVQEQDQWTVAHLGDVEARAVGGDVPVGQLAAARDADAYD